MFKNIKDFSVMPRKCSTCPFRTDENGKHPDLRLVERIKQTTLTEASQICHHPRLSGKEENHLCRGARDWQLQVFYRLGIIKEPTDAAWLETWQQLQQPK
jgi:hypothetical protein